MAYAPFNLTGKVALVTGGNRGIGLGMAKAVAEAGADIVVWGRSASENKAALGVLDALGVRALAQQVDVADEKAVVEAMAEAATAMGRLDSVFANAGIGIASPSFVDMDAATYDKVMSVNMDGAFFTCREACRHMVERAKSGDSGGSIAVTSSLAAIDGAARNQAYAAAKGGVITMMKAIAVEHARYGIRANAILPGWVATEMTTRNQESEKFNANVISRVPSRRWGQPEDFGGIAVYLTSDASSFHSGDTFLIDGGYAIY
jgi:NAD(P)-dependent dehydrogenase (short-subunit alcohol dehydrogenase family)